MVRIFSIEFFSFFLGVFMVIFLGKYVLGKGVYLDILSIVGYRIYIDI